MKLVRRLLVLPLVLLVACSGGDEGASPGMDGMIDGVPVEDYEATTTVPTETTAATTSTTTTSPETTTPPETTAPTEAAEAPEDPELAAWRSATAAVCDDYEPRLEAAAGDLDDPETLADAAAYFDQVNPVNARYMRAIVAVPVPEERREDIEELYALATDLKDVARVAQAAAHYDDQAAFDLAATGLGVSGDAADELLLSLDVPECVSEEDGGTA